MFLDVRSVPGLSFNETISKEKAISSINNVSVVFLYQLPIVPKVLMFQRVKIFTIFIKTFSHYAV